ncbi:hypothetical protein H2248_003039 [Termitomyces sp. 'cryptogamus']|nr:hypothetical protein H2248_003039 [Termitomyces sp. 'cryptogamus']
MTILDRDRQMACPGSSDLSFGRTLMRHGKAEAHGSRSHRSPIHAPPTIPDDLDGAEYLMPCPQLLGTLEFCTFHEWCLVLKLESGDSCW